MFSGLKILHNIKTIQTYQTYETYETQHMKNTCICMSLDSLVLKSGAPCYLEAKEATSDVEGGGYQRCDFKAAVDGVAWSDWGKQWCYINDIYMIYK